MGERLPPVEEAGWGCLGAILLLLLVGLGIGGFVTYWYIAVSAIAVLAIVMFVAIRTGRW